MVRWTTTYPVTKARPGSLEWFGGHFLQCPGYRIHPNAGAFQGDDSEDGFGIFGAKDDLGNGLEPDESDAREGQGAEWQVILCR